VTERPCSVLTKQCLEKVYAELPGQEESVLSDSNSDNLAFIVRHWEIQDYTMTPSTITYSLVAPLQSSMMMAAGLGQKAAKAHET
jgi:hypothetical protein